jgi:zinc transporter ZupT
VVVLLAFGPFLTTLLGGFAAIRIPDYRHLVLGLVAGLMLGVVGFDLIPEALSQEPSRLNGLPLPLLTFLLGFVVLHIIERAAGVHRATSPSTPVTTTRRRSGCSPRPGWSGTA